MAASVQSSDPATTNDFQAELRCLMVEFERLRREFVLVYWFIAAVEMSSATAALVLNAYDNGYWRTSIILDSIATVFAAITYTVPLQASATEAQNAITIAGTFEFNPRSMPPRLYRTMAQVNSLYRTHPIVLCPGFERYMLNADKKETKIKVSRLDKV